jgi:hypothetical protein
MNNYIVSITATLLLLFTSAACEKSVSGVALDKATLALNIGSTEALVATIHPEKAVVNSVAWSSNNTNVATVSNKGVVTAISKGIAAITVAVTSKDIKRTASCAVEVLIPISNIALNKTETTLTVGEKEKVKATIAPENADNKDLAWTSSDKDVATVDADGTITAIRVGAATVTASARDGSNTAATCEVIVRLPHPKRGDVYVAGTSGGDATLWINGDPKSLGKGEACSVFVGGDDIWLPEKGMGMLPCGQMVYPSALAKKIMGQKRTRFLRLAKTCMWQEKKATMRCYGKMANHSASTMKTIRQRRAVYLFREKMYMWRDGKPADRPTMTRILSKPGWGFPQVEVAERKRLS